MRTQSITVWLGSECGWTITGYLKRFFFPPYFHLELFSQAFILRIQENVIKVLKGTYWGLHVALLFSYKLGYDTRVGLADTYRDQGIALLYSFLSNMRALSSFVLLSPEFRRKAYLQLDQTSIRHIEIKLTLVMSIDLKSNHHFFFSVPCFQPYHLSSHPKYCVPYRHQVRRGGGVGVFVEKIPEHYWRYWTVPDVVCSFRIQGTLAIEQVCLF